MNLQTREEGGRVVYEAGIRLAELWPHSEIQGTSHTQEEGEGAQEVCLTCRRERPPTAVSSSSQGAGGREGEESREPVPTYTHTHTHTHTHRHTQAHTKHQR